MTGRRLPIGIRTFRKIREQDYYYVDKTAYLRSLTDRGTHYFLSRPRRFGKSLLLDTLKELFEGNEALFRGLAIHGDWDWSVRYPVLVLAFGSGTFLREGDLADEAAHQLETLERDAEIIRNPVAAAARFRSLIRSLHERTGQPVVVLVDEYDKPILDTLEVPEVARANRDFLRGLYGAVKECDAHIRFAFSHRYHQVLQGEPVLRPQQSGRHHAGPALRCRLRLYGHRPRDSLRSGTVRPRARQGPCLVQRVQLARRRECLQPD